MSLDAKQAILLLSMGEPSSSGELSVYLKRRFSFFSIAQKWRYSKFVKKARFASLHNQQIKKNAKNLEKRFLKTNLGFPIYEAFLFSEPSLEKTLKEMVAENVHEVVLVLMEPYFSFNRVGKLIQAYQEKVDCFCPFINTFFVRSWWQEDEFLLGEAHLIKQAIELFKNKEGEKHILFVVEADLPKVSQATKTYEEQLHLSILEICEALRWGDNKSLLEIESCSTTKKCWENVDLELKKLKQAGVDDLIIVPLSNIFDQYFSLTTIGQDFMAKVRKASFREVQFVESFASTDYFVRLLEKVSLSKLLNIPLIEKKAQG